MWLFKDLYSGEMLLFNSNTKADKFMKKYGWKMYLLNGEFPRIQDDYIVEYLEVNPDIKEILQRMFPDN